MTYEEIIQDARDRSPAFTDAVMDGGQARRRVKRIADELIKEARLLAPRFYSSEFTITGGPYLIDLYPSMMTLGFQNATLGVDYLPETGHHAQLDSATPDPNLAPLTLNPWADRLTPQGLYPIAYMDGVIYPLGTTDTWAQVLALYINHPSPVVVGVPTAATTYPFPDQTVESVTATLAFDMAVRAVGLDLKVPLAAFEQARDGAKSILFQTLLRTGRPRVKRIRDVFYG